MIFNVDHYSNAYFKKENMECRKNAFVAYFETAQYSVSAAEWFNGTGLDLTFVDKNQETVTIPLSVQDILNLQEVFTKAGFTKNTSKR